MILLVYENKFLIMRKKLIESASGIEILSKDDYSTICMTFNGQMSPGDMLYSEKYPKLSIKVLFNDFKAANGILHECALTEISDYNENWQDAFTKGSTWIHLPSLTSEERMNWLTEITYEEESKIKVQRLINTVSASIFNTKFHYIVEYDKKYGNRVYIQVSYNAKCTKTGKSEVWHGRKFYLSDHMTDDEIIKTAYVAFKMAVEHEVMEGFKVNNTVLFNPHTDYKALLSVSDKEVKRR
jgi:hypothetical protein